MHNTWKDIPGYGGNYKINQTGVVKNRNNVILTIQVKASSKKVSLRNLHNNKYNHLTVSHLVAKTFLDNPKNYKHLSYKDGNNLNVNLNNLEWCESKSKNTKNLYNILNKKNMYNEHINKINNLWNDFEKTKSKYI